MLRLLDGIEPEGARDDQEQHLFVRILKLSVRGTTGHAGPPRPLLLPSSTRGRG